MFCKRIQTKQNNNCRQHKNKTQNKKNKKTIKQIKSKNTTNDDYNHDHDSSNSGITLCAFLLLLQLNKN